MSYIFETEDRNYEDFASGRVLYNQLGATSFPVRLGSEIFLRCGRILHKAGANGPYTIYDPCCGGAYLLTAIGFLHGEQLSRIVASDIDGKMVALAERNLSLLSLDGMEQRISHIRKMITDFDKASHADALKSAINLKELLLARSAQIATRSFVADATKEECIKEKTDGKVDIVITDLPYGKLVHWGDMPDECVAIGNLLDGLISVLAQKSVVAVVSGKKTAFRHDCYQRVEWFQIGKRKVTFLRLAD